MVTAATTPSGTRATAFDLSRTARLAWVLLVVVALLVAAALRFAWMPNPPPALNVDEAANGQDVLNILAGHFAIFFPRVNGREPLWFYVMAPFVAVLGRTSLALRYPMACFGLVTVAATYALGRSWFGRWAGLLAAASLGTAFWDLTLTRTALRTGAVPLFVVLFFYALGTAFRTGRRSSALLSGVWMACGLYTYLSMRLVAAALAIGFAGHMVLPWMGAARWRRLAWEVGVIAAVTASVLVLPLALYFARHPAMFLERAGQVSVFNPHPHIIGQQMGFATSLLHTAGGFFLQGDEDWKQNLPGRPVFDPVNGAVWLIGLLVVCRRVWHAARARWPCAFVPEFWLLIWAVGVLGGMALAQESPYFPRQSAAIPAVHLCWAVGAQALCRFALRRGAKAARAAGVAVVALLLFQTGASARDLFVTWGAAPQAWRAFDGDLFTAVAALRASPYAGLDPARMVVQLDAASGFLYPLPQMRRSVWVRQYSSALPLPATGSGGALFVYPHLVFQPPFPTLFPGAQPVISGTGPTRHVAYLFYYLPSRTLARVRHPAVPIDRSFGRAVTVVGLEQPVPTAPLAAGQQLHVTLLWRVDRAGRENFGLFVHLVDVAGHTWAVSDDQADVWTGWQQGQEVLSGHRLTVPVDAPPGRYHLVIGAGLRSLDEQPSRYLRDLGAAQTVATIDVGPPAGVAAAPRVTHPVSRTFGGLQLLGTGAVAPTLQQGNSLDVPVVWHLTGAAPPLNVALALQRPDGTIAAQSAFAPPGGPGYPPRVWPIGRFVRDYRTVRAGPAMPAGSYRLALLVRSPPATVPQRVPLGAVSVTARPRSYARPSPSHPLHIIFGRAIRLLGYDLTSPATPGGHLTLTLYWQAVVTPSRDMTVFVHILGPDSRIVAQHDAQPLDGQAPTTGWLPGEIVTDRVSITLPPQLTVPTIQPEIGWYDATTGKRLPISAGGSGGHVLLPPLAVSPRS